MSNGQGQYNYERANAETTTRHRRTTPSQCQSHSRKGDAFPKVIQRRCEQSTLEVDTSKLEQPARGHPQTPARFARGGFLCMGPCVEFGPISRVNVNTL